VGPKPCAPAAPAASRQNATTMLILLHDRKAFIISTSRCSLLCILPENQMKDTHYATPRIKEKIIFLAISLFLS
jgi:hypothetical protein